MLNPAAKTGRFRLPRRIRTRQVGGDNVGSRLRLADRVSGLAGIHTREAGEATLPCSVDVYVTHTVGGDLAETAALCRIRPDAILVHGLSFADKHQVLSRGWGSLELIGVSIPLPKDDEELDVCWSILLRAYEQLTSAPAAMPEANAAVQAGCSEIFPNVPSLTGGQNNASY